MATSLTLYLSNVPSALCLVVNTHLHPTFLLPLGRSTSSQVLFFFNAIISFFSFFDWIQCTHFFQHSFLPILIPKCFLNNFMYFYRAKFGNKCSIWEWQVSKETKLVSGCWVHCLFSFLRAISESRSLMTFEVDIVWFSIPFSRLMVRVYRDSRVGCILE